MGNTTAYTMMTGTEGKADYLAIARKGAFALGLKPNQVIPGTQMGMPNRTWFGARLRAAGAAFLIEDISPDEPTNVIEFKSIPKAPGEAWPHVEWEKADHNRASSQIGAWVDGSVLTGADNDLIMSKLRDRVLANDMAAYAAEIAGQDYLLLTVEQIASWLQKTFFLPFLKQLEKQAALNASMTHEIDQNVGKFGVAAAMVKKAYKSVADDAEFDDEDQSDDEND